MIFIPKFTEDFIGEMYETPNGGKFEAIGYGDNDANGNPYIIGKQTDSNGKTILRTHRFDKDRVEFLP